MGDFTSNQKKIQSLPLSAFGDMRTAEITPQFQGVFEYTVDNTELNINTVANGGTVSQASAMAVISSSTTTASTAMLQSKRHARYRPGLGSLCRFTTLFTAGVAVTEQYIGLLDEIGSSAAFKNGVAIGFDGENFGLHRFDNDTKVSISQTDWDDPLDGSGISGMTIDLEKLNVWAITYQYLGAGQITLKVENPETGDLETVHAIKYANTNIVPSSFNPNYHYTIFVDNKATTSDLTAKCSSYSYFIEGRTKHFEVHQPHFSSGLKEKNTVTSEVAIFTIRNKSTYQSKTNYIDLVLEFVSAAIEASSANNIGGIRLVRDASLGGAPSFSDISTSNSVVEIDTSGTTVTGGRELFNVALAGKNDREAINVSAYDIIIAPGETLTLAGSSANSATVDGSILWKELF